MPVPRFRSQSSAPANGTVGNDPPFGPVPWINQRRQSFRVGPPTFAIQSGWHPLTKRFMRTLVIIVIDPATGAPLLASGCGRGRSSHFGLVNPMHLFMSPVVLGLGSSGKLDVNAQLQPPSRQARQVQRAIASKGRAAIDANDLGHAIASKKLLKIEANGFMT